jgi:phosphoribosylglycinamide formyltransferase-1
MIMSERFVSEVIRPVVATCDTSRMAVGEPGLPREFVWRGRTIKIAAVLRTWRETGKCRHGSGFSGAALRTLHPNTCKGGC